MSSCTKDTEIWKDSWIGIQKYINFPFRKTCQIQTCLWHKVIQSDPSIELKHALNILKSGSFKDWQIMKSLLQLSTSLFILWGKSTLQSFKYKYTCSGHTEKVIRLQSKHSGLVFPWTIRGEVDYCKYWFFNKCTFITNNERNIQNETQTDA